MSADRRLRSRPTVFDQAVNRPRSDSPGYEGVILQLFRPATGLRCRAASDGYRSFAATTFSLLVVAIGYIIYLPLGGVRVRVTVSLTPAPVLPEPGSSTIPGGDTATHSGGRALPQVTFLWSAVSRETSRTVVLRVPFIVAFRSIFQKIHRTT